MMIGYVCKSGRGAVDKVLAEVVAELQAQGVRLAGTVQTNCDIPDSTHCDMDLRVLPDGPEFRISQSLGSGSTGCRLNPAALEEAVHAVSIRLDGAEILVVNKFGKHESEGRGFRSLIAEALARGLPVLMGVNTLNLGAFHDFCGDFAVRLPADQRSIADWANGVIAKAGA